jgi:GNAT superfamily N-acetyltransferase
MKTNLRRAVAADKAAIAGFTADTFEWGDYVADAFSDWISDPDGIVMVATDDNDDAVAMGRGLLLSETELWMQGARVSPSWRRRGLATEIGAELMAWGRGRGALVARLGTEAWNVPARRQVESAGFRAVGEWVVAMRSVPSEEPATSSNGGQRAKARRKLERTHSSESIPAWVSWRSGPLVQPARGLHSWHWRWSQLEVDHLTAAAKRGELWSSQAGWAYVRQEDDRFSVGWLECGPDDAVDMMRSLLDLAIAVGTERLHIAVPAVPWLTAALESTNFSLHPMIVYEFPL